MDSDEARHDTAHPGCSGDGEDDCLDLDDEDGKENGETDTAALEHLDDRITWHTNALVLYDLFFKCEMEWPALTVAWLPDEPGERARIAYGTQTDGSDPCELVIAEFVCHVESELTDDPWRQWKADGIGSVEGFGCSVHDGIEAPVRTIARWRHPTEVNRVAPCPHQPKIIATKAANGAVLLFNSGIGKDVSGPEATLLADGCSADGFALAWSRLDPRLIATGGNDGRMCVWDVQAVSDAGSGAKSPLTNLVAHTGALCDLSFSSFSPGLLATVGDSDRELRLWDARAGLESSLRAVVSEDEVLSVDWSFRQEHYLATAGKDKRVCIWDTRSLRSPLHALLGHDQDSVAVRWAPFRENLLASCSTDSRVCIWDLQGKPQADDDEDADETPPELLFTHAGHTAGVSDFSWSPMDDYLLCSVADDNMLQVWQPQTAFYLGESDAENDGEQATGEPSPKRSRPEPSSS